MAIAEYFPPHTEQPDDKEYFELLEREFRDPATIRQAEITILSEDPELYQIIAEAAASLSPGNPVLHQFYFTEFLLTALREHDAWSTRSNYP